MTRFYLPNGATGAAAAVSPAFRAGWTVTTSARRVEMRPIKQGTTEGAIQRTNGSATTPLNRLIDQFVSAPIQGGLISGKVNSIQRCNEDNAANNAATQGVLYVVSNDGSVVRGILFDFDDVTSTSGGNEFNTTGANKYRWPRGAPAGGVAMTPVLAQDGDRLVFELGFRAAPSTGNANRFASFRVGDDSGTPPATGDQPDSTGSTAATTDVWLDVGEDIGLDVFIVRNGGGSAVIA